MAVDEQHDAYPEPRRTVTLERQYAHPPERVYDAWLDPTAARQWLFATSAGEMVRAEIDARVGGQFVFTDRREGQDVEHVGEYLELRRPQLIVFTFGVPQFSEKFTRVSVEIRPAGTGSLLTLTHAGVLPDYAERTAQGWDMILDGLGRELE